MGFTHFGFVEFVGNTLASHFFAEVGMNIFCELPGRMVPPPWQGARSILCLLNTFVSSLVI